MAEKKKSFVMYYEYLENFEMLDKNDRADLIMIILRYVNGQETGLSEASSAVRMAFAFIRKRLDEDYAKYQEVCKKRSEAAKKRFMQLHANAGDNDSDSESDIVSDTESDSDSESDFDSDPDPVVVSYDNNRSADAQETTTNAPRADIPTEEELNDYCVSRNNNIDTQKFMDYYSAKGWYIGREPMRNWRAAVRTWERNNIYNNNNTRAAPSYDLDEYSERIRAKYLACC